MTYKFKHDATDFFLLTVSEEKTPEKRLLVAIVQRAVMDYIDPSIAQVHRREARKYLHSTSKEPFSLRWICDMLDNEPEKRRLKIIGQAEELKASGGRVPGTSMRVDK